MPSISALSAANSQQAAVARSQASRLESEKLLSATAANRLRLTNLAASQQTRESAFSAVADAQREATKTVIKAETTSGYLYEAGAIVNRMTDLIGNAMYSSDAGERSTINEELSSLKNALNTTTKSMSVEGENWVYEPAVASSSQTKAPDAVLVSDTNAQNGVLTKSYSGTTVNGTAYSYHLLSSASTSSSSEIAVSATTSNEELQGMRAALGKMLQGISSAQSNVASVSNKAREAESDAIQKQLGSQTSSQITDFTPANREKLFDMASNVRDQLAASRLPIANVQMSALALLR